MQLGLLEAEMSNLSTATNTVEKLNHLNNIIEIYLIDCEKKSNVDISKKIYKYIKKYIYLSMEDSDTLEYGYYNINVEKIFSYISKCSDDIAITLLKQFCRLLQLNGFEKEAVQVKKQLKKRELLFAINSFKFKNSLNVIFRLATYNLISIAISIIVVYLLYFILLLPASSHVFEFYKIEYQNYSSSFYLNHFLNTLSGFCAIDSDFKIISLNSSGVMLLVLFKIISIFIILKYLVQRLEKQFNND